MPNFSTIEDTLFVPMLGRIYASENFPHVLYDPKALELKDQLPQNLKGQNSQTQYTLMASAVRSKNMDRYICDFLKRNPDGIIAELGCGLETAFWRNGQEGGVWYEIDLPNVIEYRKSLLEQQERDITIAADAFGESWIAQIRQAHPDAPLLVTASGLFYYFPQQQVLELFRKLGNYPQVEVVFDTVNSKGMKRMSKYMKQVGHEEAVMYFYVDSGKDMAAQVGGTLLAEQPYYAYTKKHDLTPITALTMKISDRFSMVKMIHMRLSR